MKFRIEIDCGNAAFEGEPLGEVQRILVEEAKKMERWVGDGTTCWDNKLYDLNGNAVGRAQFVKEPGDA